MHGFVGAGRQLAAIAWRRRPAGATPHAPPPPERPISRRQPSRPARAGGSPRRGRPTRGRRRFAMGVHDRSRGGDEAACRSGRKCSAERLHAAALGADAGEQEGRVRHAARAGRAIRSDAVAPTTAPTSESPLEPTPAAPTDATISARRSLTERPSARARS